MSTVTKNSHSTLTLSGIRAEYDGKPLFSLPLWQCEAASTSLILGASGCGKTTLLSIIAGIRKPDSGTVCYGDIDLYQLSERERDRFRGQHIGLLFQNFHLLKAFTVQQNLKIALRLSGNPAPTQGIEPLLASLNLAQKAHQLASRLSVGEAQRLALARAVITQPKWLLCDEPTSALDDTNAEKMLQLLKEHSATCGASLIIVTHDKRVREFFHTAPILTMGG